MTIAKTKSYLLNKSIAEIPTTTSASIKPLRNDSKNNFSFNIHKPPYLLSNGMKSIFWMASNKSDDVQNTNSFLSLP